MINDVYHRLFRIETTENETIIRKYLEFLLFLSFCSSYIAFYLNCNILGAILIFFTIYFTYMLDCSEREIIIRLIENGRKKK